MKQYKKVEKHKKKHKEEEKHKEVEEIIPNHKEEEHYLIWLIENALKDQIEYNEGDPSRELFDDVGKNNQVGKYIINYFKQMEESLVKEDSGPFSATYEGLRPEALLPPNDPEQEEATFEFIRRRS